MNFSKNKNQYLKTKSSKDQRFNFDFLKKKQNIWNKPLDTGDSINDFDLNNIILTSGSNSNKENQSDYNDIKILFILFRKNFKLKSNIIIEK